MSQFQDILRARSAAVHNAKADGVIEGHKETTVEEDPTKLSTIATGMASSADFSGVADTVHATKLVEFDKELAEKALFAYENRHLNRLILQDGSKIEPIKGYYYPVTEEQVQMLDYFETQGKVTRKVD